MGQVLRPVGQEGCSAGPTSHAVGQLSRAAGQRSRPGRPTAHTVGRPARPPGQDARSAGPLARPAGQPASAPSCFPEPQPLIPPRPKQEGEHPPGQLGGGFVALDGFLEELQGGGLAGRLDPRQSWPLVTLANFRYPTVPISSGPQVIGCTCSAELAKFIVIR